MKYKFKIKGIDCANCALELERAIKKVYGVNQANINFITERFEFECDENNFEDIMKKIQKVIKKEEPDCKIEKV